jgi:TetR/AcrR family transcriptional regulator
MPRPRSEDYDDKRQEILDKAAALFAEQGFSRTSISQISREQNASKAYIYHYYDSKEAILEDILAKHIRMLRDVVLTAAAGYDDPHQRLQSVLTALLEAYQDADAKHRVLLQDLDLLPEQSQREIKAMERDIVDVFAAIVGALNPALKDNRTYLKPATMSLLGMLNWHFTWYRPDGPLSHRDYAGMVTKLFVNGVKALP